MVVAALLVFPAAAGAASLLGRQWYATSDQALEVLHIGDVGGVHTPLVGIPSRFGWYHPGPLLYWLLAPFVRLFGETGVLTGSAVLNVAALVGVAVVARRRGGTPLVLWTGLLIAALLHTLGPGFLLDPWNPWLALLPFLLFVFLAWSVTCGDFACLPWAVGVGTFVVQTHVSYALLVAGLLVVVLGVAGLERLVARQAGGAPVDLGISTSGSASKQAGMRRWFVVAGVVMVVLWLPPLIQQLAGHPGNLGEIVRYFTNRPASASAGSGAVAPGPPAGWTTGLGVMGKQLAPPGPWLTGRDTNQFGFAATAALWPGTLLILAAAGAGSLAWWRRAFDAARLALVAVALSALGIVATARITGILATYLVRWWWVVALMLWLAIGWCLGQALGLVPPERGPTVPAPGRQRSAVLARPAGVAAVAGTVTLVVATLVAALSAPLPGADSSEAVAHLAPTTARALDHKTTDLVQWIDPVTLSATGFGVYTELRREGFDVVVSAKLAFGFGSERTAARASVHDVVTVVAMPDRGSPLEQPSGARLVASYDPLTASERAESMRLAHRIRSAMGSRAPLGPLVVPRTRHGQDQLVAGGASRRDVERLAQLQAQGTPYVVFLAPAAA